MILDPAKLTRDREQVIAALKKYNDMNKLAMQVIKPGGVLLTCSCTGLVSEEEFLDMIRRAAFYAGRTVQVLEGRRRRRRPSVHGTREGKPLPQGRLLPRRITLPFPHTGRLLLMTSMPDSLDAVWTQAWARLLAGARGRSDPFHQGVLANVSADGPQARYAVLRAVDPGAGTVAFHTDRRSPKVAQLLADPRLGWCFFGHGEQVRLSGTVQLHTDDAVADAAWAASGRSARQNYAGAMAPGTLVGEPGEGGPPGLGAPPLDAAGQALARGNFAFARLTVDSLDWLSLSASRPCARALRARHAGWHAIWITP